LADLSLSPLACADFFKKYAVCCVICCIIVIVVLVLFMVMG